MPSLSHNAYQSSQKLARTPRETEGRALMEAARRLEDVKSTDADREVYRAALRLNWRLWTIFQADISEESNPLPLEIKRNMLQLSRFVDRQTIAAMPRVKPDELQVLIDINRTIATGLLENPNQAAVSAAPGATPAASAPASAPGTDTTAAAGLNTQLMA